MSIQMIGIDHTRASIDVRTVFSFTKKSIAETLERWKQVPGLEGCVIISTCNRMEVWMSCSEETLDLFALLCAEKKVDANQFRKYMVVRKDREAVNHLLELSCGLQSRILGEDQIITQVKDALALAREQYATDNVLEVLFRMAITAAKKVKTEIVLSDGNRSAIHGAVRILKEKGYVLENKKCMIIGNGEMGKLSANAFRQEGADVTVTVRQYRSGVVQIPEGCSRINYGDRLELLPECDYVVSATSSPNYTLTREAVEGLTLKKNIMMIDLAVPRDIEPSVGKLEHITLYDIDAFHIEHTSEQVKQNIEKAKVILDHQMEEFFDWYEGRDVIEKVQKIKAGAVEDFRLRTQKEINELRRLPQLQDEGSLKQINELQKYLETSAGKVVNKMLFSLKGKVSDQVFRECMEVLGEVF